METIKEARKFVKENFKKGCKCPVCEQTVKLYRRKLNAGMAATLWHIFLEDKTGSEFIQVKDMLRQKGVPNTHDWTLLAHWGILEQSPVKSKVGYWRITPKGIDFIMGRLKVPEAILMYNNKVAEVEGEVTTLSFKEALKSRINIEEAMASAGIQIKKRVRTLS